MGVLPGCDNKDSAEGKTLDVSLEAWFVGICERDVGQGGRGDIEHVAGSLEETPDFSSTLCDGSAHLQSEFKRSIFRL